MTVLQMVKQGTALEAVPREAGVRRNAVGRAELTGSVSDSSSALVFCWAWVQRRVAAAVRGEEAGVVGLAAVLGKCMDQTCVSVSCVLQAMDNYLLHKYNI